MGTLLIVGFLSYILGAVPSSLWVGKIYKKIDLREHGSGNLGATNTFRILGWKAGVVVGIMDFMKGFAAAFWISGIAVDVIPSVYSGWETGIFIQIYAGLMAVVGHMYSLFAKFKGGKGVLTACGMLYAIEPISISLALLVFVAVLFTSRYVSMASILATLSYPVFLLMLRYGFNFTIDGSLMVITALIVITIVVKHRSNIKRLIEGTESRISSFSPAKGRINEEQPG
ncbi:MAG: glycerol-3-phosphate 1-O-acyltransferase PlsY [Balneolales bacterium]|nr:glycerol-3-phosphate 1-O-acyltransferase PlsY [Balneolales bacterium]